MKRKALELEESEKEKGTVDEVSYKAKAQLPPDSQRARMIRLGKLPQSSSSTTNCVSQERQNKSTDNTVIRKNRWTKERKIKQSTKENSMEASHINQHNPLRLIPELSIKRRIQRGKIWRTTPTNLLQENQANMMTKLFQRCHDISLLKEVENEFGRMNKIIQVKDDLTKAEQCQHTYATLHSMEVRTDHIVDDVPIKFDYFKTQVYPTFFARLQRWEELHKAINTAKTFAEMLNQCYETNYSQFKGNVEIVQNNFTNKLIIKRTIDPKMFRELFEAGLVCDIRVTTTTKTMVSKVPQMTKYFEKLHQILSMGGKEVQHVLVYSAPPLWQFFGWTTIEQARSQPPEEYPSCHVLIEATSEEWEELSVDELSLPVTSENKKERAVGLQMIYKLLQIQDYHCIEDQKRITFLGLDKNLMVNLHLELLEEDSKLHRQMLCQEKGPADPSYGESDKPGADPSYGESDKPGGHADTAYGESDKAGGAQAGQEGPHQDAKAT